MNPTARQTKNYTCGIRVALGDWRGHLVVDDYAGYKALFALGVWACEVTGRAMGASDHGGMVWDETGAFLLVLFFVPAALPWQAAAFLLFRLFDILKPPPIRYYERTFRNGFGVMLDDALYQGQPHPGAFKFFITVQPLKHPE